jgi:hypothetical protein
MNILLKNISMDLVKKILSYDKRFIIHKGQIIVINLLDIKKLLLSNSIPALLKFNYYEGIINCIML